MPLTVYEHTGFPNPLRIRIAAAEKGLQDRIAYRHIDVTKNEHKTQEFLALNPSGLVPALQLEDGAVLAECVAITDYLDGQSGEADLTGRDARDRAVISMTHKRIEDGFLNAVGTYFHHATDGLGPDVEIYQNKEWGEKNRERAEAFLVYLDGLLEDRIYMAGDRFTVADITAIAGVVFAGFAEIAIPTSLENLTAWRDRVWARPSVTEALQAA